PSGRMNFSHFVGARSDRWARSLSLGGPMSAVLADMRRPGPSICHAQRQRDRDYQTCNQWLTFVLMRSVELGRKSHGVSVTHSTPEVRPGRYVEPLVAVKPTSETVAPASAFRPVGTVEHEYHFLDRPSGRSS